MERYLSYLFWKYQSILKIINLAGVLSVKFKDVVSESLNLHFLSKFIIQYKTDQYIAVIGEDLKRSRLNEFEAFIVLEVEWFLDKEVASLSNCHLPELQVVLR